jgi:TolA-binding protein
MIALPTALPELPCHGPMRGVLVRLSAVVCVAWASAVSGQVGEVGEVGDVPRALPVGEVEARGVDPAAGGASKGPEEDLFDYANYVYSQGQFQLAASKYSDYIRTYPQGKRQAEAWFRLGECHMGLGDVARADQAFLELLKRFPKGPVAAGGAYRLATFRYRNADFQAARAYFSIAAEEATDRDVRLSATYYKGLSFRREGRPEDSILPFEIVVREVENNPYRESGRLMLAASFLDLGRKADAARVYDQLLEEHDRAAARPGGVAGAVLASEAARGEALVKSGLLLAEGGDAKGAIERFQRVMQLGAGAEEWKAYARFNLIQTYHGDGDYDAVIAAYTGGRAGADLPEDYRSRILLLVGDAFQRKGRYTSAIEVYQLVEASYRGTEQALEAGYRKLVCFYKIGDGKLAEFTDRFVSMYREEFPQHRFLHMGRLIEADSLFGKGEFEAAAAAFGAVSVDKLPEELQAQVWFNRGWAEVEAEKFGPAAESFGKYLELAPEGSNVAAALLRRGESFVQVSDFEGALADFGRVIEEHVGRPAREAALQQAARARSQQRDMRGMIATYQTLIDDYPATVAKAEAYYQIGWGHYELREFEECVGPLERAMEVDGELYAPNARPRLIVAYWSLQEVEKLAAVVDAQIEADASRRRGASSGAEGGEEVMRAIPVPEEGDLAGEVGEVGEVGGVDEERTEGGEGEQEGQQPERALVERVDPAASVPRNALIFLGLSLLEEQNYQRAEHYLRLASYRDEPDELPLEVWRSLIEARLEIGDFDGSVEAAEYYLAREELPRAEQGRALLMMGRAQLALGRYGKARLAARDGLARVPEGRVNGQLNLLYGDACLAEALALRAGSYVQAPDEVRAPEALLGEAAASFLRVSEFFGDEQLTPEALAKAARTYEELGQLERAQEKRDELAQKYPGYKG